MPRIFLVEDDREIAKNLTLLLRSEGFTVTHAPTREEAFAAADGNKFDLALILRCPMEMVLRYIQRSRRPRIFQ